MTASKDFCERISEVEPDRFILSLVASESRAEQIIIDCASLGMYTRALRGSKMRPMNDLYD